MLKRRFANSAEGDFRLKYLDNEHFKGWVCCNILKCDKPLVVNCGEKKVCIKDDGYVWILVYPNEANYAITMIFDDKMSLMEWYFDIAKSVGVENGVPYEDDMFLDMAISPEGQAFVLDEDELLDARSKEIISEEDVKLAYSTLKLLQKKYCQNVESLRALTRYFCGQFDLRCEL